MRLSQHRFRASAILDICGMNLHDEEISFGVNGEMALPSHDLLAAIKTTLVARCISGSTHLP